MTLHSSSVTLMRRATVLCDSSCSRWLFCLRLCTSACSMALSSFSCQHHTKHNCKLENLPGRPDTICNVVEKNVMVSGQGRETKILNCAPHQSWWQISPSQKNKHLHLKCDKCFIQFILIPYVCHIYYFTNFILYTYIKNFD